MKTKMLAVLCSMLIVSSAGCATPRERQYTASGAGIGAITGAILGAALGSLTGDAGEGAVIGSVFGGLTGASIGHDEFHRHRSEIDAADMYAYDYANQRSDFLRIEDSTADPYTVSPGEEINLNVTYTVLTPYRGSQIVHEVREIRHDGRLIGKPSVTVRRQGGTWASTIPMRLPEDAKPGEYVVTTIIETDNAGDVRETAFVVERGSRWRR